MSSTLSDPYLFAAFWTGVGALLLTLALGAQIVALRISLRRKEAHRQQTVSTWRPLLSAAVAGDMPGVLPALQPRDRIPFLKLWIHLHASLRGEASAGLNEVARRLGCDEIALRLLAGGRRAEQLLGMLVLGYLREPRAGSALQGMLTDGDSVISLYAAWALVQSDPAAAAKSLPQLAITREDWPLSQVVAILQEGGAPCIDTFAASLANLDGTHLLRALRIAEGLRIELAPATNEKLLCSDNIDVVVGALRLAANPALLPAVRTLAGHADWRVRVQAAKALGRLAEYTDVGLLRQMLGDSQWWVRYRAAQALSSLPFLPPQEIDALSHGLQDRYATDMMRQVLAEGGQA